MHALILTDQKVPAMEKQMQAAEYTCYQNKFPWDIARKKEVLLQGKFFKISMRL